MPDQDSRTVNVVAASPADEHSLLGLVRTLWRRRWAIVGTTAATLAIGGAVALVVEPRYQAEAKVVVDPRAATPLGWDTAGPPSIDGEMVQNEVQTLLSHDLVQPQSTFCASGGRSWQR